jgi:hypothetical protein
VSVTEGLQITVVPTVTVVVTGSNVFSCVIDTDESAVVDAGLA